MNMFEQNNMTRVHISKLTEIIEDQDDLIRNLNQEIADLKNKLVLPGKNQKQVAVSFFNSQKSRFDRDVDEALVKFIQAGDFYEQSKFGPDENLSHQDFIKAAEHLIREIKNHPKI